MRENAVKWMNLLLATLAFGAMGISGIVAQADSLAAREENISEQETKTRVRFKEVPANVPHFTAADAEQFPNCKANAFPGWTSVLVVDINSNREVIEYHEAERMIDNAVSNSYWVIGNCS